MACGVAAAFGSPVGGLLFAMEEVASFWSQQLGWMIFFGCMCAVFTTDIMNSAFKGYEYLGEQLFKNGRCNCDPWKSHWEFKGVIRNADIGKVGLECLAPTWDRTCSGTRLYFQ